MSEPAPPVFVTAARRVEFIDSVAIPADRPPVMVPYRVLVDDVDITAAVRLTRPDDGMTWWDVNYHQGAVYVDLLLRPQYVSVTPDAYGAGHHAVHILPPNGEAPIELLTPAFEPNEPVEYLPAHNGVQHLPGEDAVRVSLFAAAIVFRGATTGEATRPANPAVDYGGTLSAIAASAL